ncbi:MAG: winged helix-turn-helix transcriptional regulator [Candidatus Pacebacteria bacterium]|nr:winged helix-turn-helix transcriptional regulator [Candidatus Paceibacterota bacterium]
MILIYIILGIIIGYGVFVYLNKGKFSKDNNLGTKEEKILDLINEKSRVANNDVEELLDVSDSTATRYLQKLEDKKLIEQKGEIGRSVYYQKIN